MSKRPSLGKGVLVPPTPFWTMSPDHPQEKKVKNHKREDEGWGGEKKRGQLTSLLKEDATASGPPQEAFAERKRTKPGNPKMGGKR